MSSSDLSHNTTNTNNGNSNGGGGDSNEDEQDYRTMETQLEKLRKDLTYIDLNFSKFEKSADKVAAGSRALLQHTLDKSLDELRANAPTPALQAKQKTQLQSRIRVLSDIVIKLKLHIPNLSTIASAAGTINRVDVSLGLDDLQVIDELPDLHYHTLFNQSYAFQDFRDIYSSLDDRTKLCLLCFALIPENEVVKKRLFVYWWVGEGFISSTSSSSSSSSSSPLQGGEEKTYEKMGDEIFLKLVKTGCIEAVNKKHRLVADTYKMNPFIRSAMIEFAKEARFFDFDKKGNPTADFSNCHRACLALNDPSQKLLRTGSRSDGSPLDHEKLQTIFNVNEPYPDFFKLEWFSKLKNVKVLYLGRWKNSASHHIEVESGEFLKGLRSMKFLRFFSLQGISRITKLPDSVCKLSSLRILDLRACHNLELLPDGIGSLKQLTHLDISECYLLEYIPKGIALLSELLVLKGFVVGDRISADSCTLGELLKLSKLRKLSIYTNVEDFPTDVEVSTIRQVKKLQKLTIVWGGGVDRHAKQLTKSTFSEGRHPAGCCHLRERKRFTRKLLKAATFKQGLRPEIPEEFKELEKLDLQCYPKMTAPSWLIPDKLAKLKKLYIRGGELQNLGQFKKNDKWKVEILRLKFLSNLKMDWNEIRASFPDLFYLEKFNCPKLTLFPCDENGLWLKPLNGR